MRIKIRTERKNIKVLPVWEAEIVRTTRQVKDMNYDYTYEEPEFQLNLECGSYRSITKIVCSSKEEAEKELDIIFRDGLLDLTDEQRYTLVRNGLYQTNS